MVSLSTPFQSGVYLALKLGMGAKKAPVYLMEALQRVEVTLKDEGSSGFQMEFLLTKTSFSLGPFSGNSDKILKEMAIDSRIILELTLKSKKHILMDGIIKNHQTAKGSGPGVTKLTVTGEDVSVAMEKKADLEAHPGQNDGTIVKKILGSYSSYGIVPAVEPPPFKKAPQAKEVVPFQGQSDLQYVRALARRWSYVFYVTPRPGGKNTAYWGPRKNSGRRQKALSVNMGPFSNVKSINFTYDAKAPKKVSANLIDAKTCKVVKVMAKGIKRTTIVKKDAMKTQKEVREEVLLLAGVTKQEALFRVQAETDGSVDKVVKAEGELDVTAYGDILKPRSLVDLRGAGVNNG